MLEYGWTFDQVADLTLDQLEVATGRSGRRGGGAGMLTIRSRADIARLMRMAGREA